jgi:hypothetical protein
MPSRDDETLLALTLDDEAAAIADPDNRFAAESRRGWMLLSRSRLSFLGRLGLGFFQSCHKPLNRVADILV